MEKAREKQQQKLYHLGNNEWLHEFLLGGQKCVPTQTNHSIRTSAIFAQVKFGHNHWLIVNGPDNKIHCTKLVCSVCVIFFLLLLLFEWNRFIWMPMKLTKNFGRNHWMHDIIFSTNTLNGQTLDRAMCARILSNVYEWILTNDSNRSWINWRKLLVFCVTFKEQISIFITQID